MDRRDSSVAASQICSVGGGCSPSRACVPALTDHSKKSAPKAIPISQMPMSEAMKPWCPLISKSLVDSRDSCSVARSRPMGEPRYQLNEVTAPVLAAVEAKQAELDAAMERWAELEDQSGG